MTTLEATIDDIIALGPEAYNLFAEIATVPRGGIALPVSINLDKL